MNKIDKVIIFLLLVCLGLFFYKSEHFTEDSDYEEVDNYFDWNNFWNIDKHNKTKKEDIQNDINEENDENMQNKENDENMQNKENDEYYCKTSYESENRVLIDSNDKKNKFIEKGFTRCTGDIPVLITAPHGGNLFLSHEEDGDVKKIDKYRNVQTLLNYTFDMWSKNKNDKKWKHFVTELKTNVKITKTKSKKTTIINTGVILEPD